MAYRHPGRRIVLVIGLLLGVCGCDVDLNWKQAADNAYRDALAALHDNDIETARERLVYALGQNPYHPKANLQLARILDRRYLKPDLAIGYYRRFLDLVPVKDAEAKAVRDYLNLLDQIRAGTVEHPGDAVEDLRWATEARDRRTFIERLHPRFIHAESRRGRSPDDTLGHWHERIPRWGEPAVVSCHIIPGSEKQDTLWLAHVVIALADSGGTAYRQFILCLTERDNPALWEVCADMPLQKK